MMHDEPVYPTSGNSLNRRQMVKLFALASTTFVACPLLAQAGKSWRQASEAELKEILPARAHVGQEHIETEMRTASGITDGHGDYMAGVVLITTGYAANGKYSHFFTTEVPVEVDSLSLAAGEYVLGWQHGESMLTVRFYDAITEAPKGSTEAHIIPGLVRVDSFRVWSPQTKSILQIGRFGIPYVIGKSTR
jgi:hypothetical protein